MPDYLKVKNSKKDFLYLFVSRENSRWAVRSIQRSVNAIIEKSNVRQGDRTLSPKTIRHTVIKTLIENEIELPIICNITGLEINTLYKYIEEFTTLPDLKEELCLEDHFIFNKKDVR